MSRPKNPGQKVNYRKITETLLNQSDCAISDESSYSSVNFVYDIDHGEL